MCGFIYFRREPVNKNEMKAKEKKLKNGMEAGKESKTGTGSS